MNVSVIEKSTDRIAVLDLESKQLQSNLVMITGEINEESVTKWQAMLFYLMSTTDKKEPIQLYINSPGGSVYAGLGLYDTIQYMKKKGFIIRTVNIGLCASMASIILLSGTEGYRESLPNCSVMMHEMSYGDWGKIQDMKDAAEEADRLQKIINDIITKNTKFDITDISRKDKWMGSDEALKCKIIDRIL